MFARFLPLAAAVLIAGCDQAPSEMTLENAWVRLPAVDGRPGAAYFTLTGSDEQMVLVAADSEAAGRAELHESMAGDGGMMRMEPIAQVVLAPAQRIAFEPGGRHVMLFDIAPGIEPGDTVPLTLSFADATMLSVDARAVAPGDPAPQPAAE